MRIALILLTLVSCSKIETTQPQQPKQKVKLFVQMDSRNGASARLYLYTVDGNKANENDSIIVGSVLQVIVMNKYNTGEVRARVCKSIKIGQWEVLRETEWNTVSASIDMIVQP